MPSIASASRSLSDLNHVRIDFSRTLLDQRVIAARARDPAGHRLRGERTGQTYRLGDEVRVRVVRVDLDERKMDFELAEAAPADTGKPGRKSRGKSRRGGKKRKRKRS